MPSSSLWQRFQQYFLSYDQPDFSIDISRMKFPDDFFSKMRPKIDKAFAAMGALEAGAIANPDEGRMVGHYWLRAPELAPDAETTAGIRDVLAQVGAFVGRVHHGTVRGAGGPFRHLVHVGIGGS